MTTAMSRRDAPAERPNHGPDEERRTPDETPERRLECPGDGLLPLDETLVHGPVPADRQSQVFGGLFLRIPVGGPA